jgi:diguanylate cyclase (GGDEF)-like protein
MIRDEQYGYEVEAEYSQCIIRIAFCIVTYALIYFLPEHTFGLQGSVYGRVSYFIGFYFIFSIIWFLYVRRFPAISPWRRIIAICVDMGAISYCMSLAGTSGTAFYPLYLWVILGNGIRFGRTYLFISLVVGVFGFTYVILRAPFWHEYITVAIGLGVGLVIITLYVNSLLERINKLNENLSIQLKETEHNAMHDSLTGLFNRYAFYEQVEQAIQRYRRNFASFWIVYIDLDGFKPVNDTYGHEIGDLLLKEVSERMKKTIRSTDIVARLGGDEFALLLTDPQKEQKTLENVAGKLLSEISMTYLIKNIEVKISASIGISQYPDNGRTTEEVIRSADSAMYAVKRSSKNSVGIAEKSVSPAFTA